MRTGIQVLESEKFKPLRGKRVGLVTHPAALNGFRASTLDTFMAIARSGVFPLAAIFGPEHGISGEAQDLIPVQDSASGPIPIYSLYGDTFESLKPTREMLKGLDVLVIDMQDNGSRYYTFQATMLYCMEACKDFGLPVIVLDRPNPLGRSVEGPTVQTGFESFIGVHPICVRHGMTIGELARLYQAERVRDLDLTVIGCEDYTPAVESVWAIPPSPNMPSLETAIAYPGMCLIEGTNLSEGRGTTRPFEYIGFPGINHYQLADKLNQHNPELEFNAYPVQFRPTFQKFANQTCQGVFLKISPECRTVRLGLVVLKTFRDLLGDRFQWRTETYEFVSHIPAIDLLFGSDRERKMIECNASWQEIASYWEPEEREFEQRRSPYLLYPNSSPIEHFR